MPKGDKKVREDIISVDHTINLRKRIHGTGFKHRAPRAIRELKKFAAKQMGTKKVIINPDLNKRVWATGVRRVPGRLRIRLSRKRNEDEDAKEDEKLYTEVEWLNEETNKRTTKV